MEPAQGLSGVSGQWAAGGGVEGGKGSKTQPEPVPDFGGRDFGEQAKGTLTGLQPLPQNKIGSVIFCPGFKMQTKLGLILSPEQ